ncbi:hypothetical protein ACTRXD_15630 [Nitrospira sp. T9]|uniref:hypothetical protein n=1 Tax=unclassified Nitrospira TaxID=2652172 RepID=UPI003F9D36D9
MGRSKAARRSGKELQGGGQPYGQQIPTAEGLLYLAVELDLFSRQVIGWAMQPQQNCGVLPQTVQMALEQRTTSAAVVLHSDRGGGHNTPPTSFKPSCTPMGWSAV